MIKVKYNQNGKEYRCIGVIISHYKVLTPAKCVYRKKFIKLEFGFLNSFEPQNTVNVSLDKITLHPKYTSDGNDYDIAVIELPNEIAFSPRVGKLDLVEENHVLESWTEVTMLGYTFVGHSINKIDSTDSTIRDFRTCRYEYLITHMIGLKEGLEFCVNKHDEFGKNAHYRGGEFVIFLSNLINYF